MNSGNYFFSHRQAAVVAADRTMNQSQISRLIRLNQQRAYDGEHSTIGAYDAGAQCNDGTYSFSENRAGFTLQNGNANGNGLEGGGIIIRD